MKVTVPSEVEDDRLYDMETIAERACLRPASVIKHRATSGCPLHGDGMRTIPGSRKIVCNAPTLRAYLSWLMGR